MSKGKTGDAESLVKVGVVVCDGHVDKDHVGVLCGQVVVQRCDSFARLQID